MKGELTEVNLVDLIQVTCHDRTPSHLAVRHQGQEASLYFADGELVHAELGAFRGEEALSEVLKWSQGSFELEKRVSTAARSLSGSSVGLLLAAMEKIDHEKSGRERRSAGYGTQEIDLSDEDLQRQISQYEESMRRELAEAPPAGVPPAGAPPAGAPPAAENPAADATAAGGDVNEEQEEQDVVGRLRRIPGVAGALRVARDGTVLAHDLDGDPEAAAAVTVFVGNAADELGEALAVGFFERGSVVVGGERTLVVEQPDWFVGLLLEERASPDLIFTEARKILEG